MVSSANNSREVCDLYRRLAVPQANATTLSTGVMSAAANAHYVGTAAYFEARDHHPSIHPEPPSHEYPPVYVCELATTDQKDLDLLLSGLGTHLYEKLRGARAALASQSPDHIGQAYASMQELLDQVLHQFADGTGEEGKDAKIRKAPWWEPDPQHGVIRLHRIRFVVQGYAQHVDDETERRIQDLAKQATVLGEIQGGKHRHGLSAQVEPILARNLLRAL